jgi:hypothetical protein
MHKTTVTVISQYWEHVLQNHLFILSQFPHSFFIRASEISSHSLKVFRVFISFNVLHCITYVNAVSMWYHNINQIRVLHMQCNKQHWFTSTTSNRRQFLIIIHFRLVSYRSLNHAILGLNSLHSIALKRPALWKHTTNTINELSAYSPTKFWQRKPIISFN